MRGGCSVLMAFNRWYGLKFLYMGKKSYLILFVSSGIFLSSSFEFLSYYLS